MMARTMIDAIPPNEPPADGEGGFVSIAVAAELLNVDQSYLNRLLNEGSIPVVNRGGERMVRRLDILEYRRTRDVQRRAHLEELVRLSEEAGMDDVDYAAIIRREP
jgi:excisionase family DNA binding protein